MTIVRIIKKYDITPNEKYCGGCEYAIEQRGWVSHWCEVFDIGLNHISNSNQVGSVVKAIRCEKCIKALLTPAPKTGKRGRMSNE